jgi:hypothetical protein
MSATLTRDEEREEERKISLTIPTDQTFSGSTFHATDNGASMPYHNQKNV